MFPLIDGPRVVACRCDQPFRCTQSEGLFQLALLATESTSMKYALWGLQKGLAIQLASGLTTAIATGSIWRTILKWHVTLKMRQIIEISYALAHVVSSSATRCTCRGSTIWANARSETCSALQDHATPLSFTCMLRRFLWVSTANHPSDIFEQFCEQPAIFNWCMRNVCLIDGLRVVACRCDQPFRCTQSEGRRRISDAASVRVKVQSITEWLFVCRHLRLDPSLCSVCRVTRRLKAQSKAPKRRLGGHWSHWVEFDISALQPRVCIAD